MILLGIDDTDVVGSRGTNQLARQIVRELAEDWQCGMILRHQLLDDPRVPYTSKNGSASISLFRRQHSPRSPDVVANNPWSADAVLETCRRVMREWFVDGSDPGLCLLSGECPPDVLHWGERCQREFVTRREAFAVAEKTGIYLEALGGTEDGVIGALAAVGLAAAQNDGRIVQLAEWPDDLSGGHSVHALHARDVQVRDLSTNQEIKAGIVDVGKHLRPNLRQGAAVLFVHPNPDGSPNTYHAVKLP